jgi:nicotinamide mononucleotide adenylyltransferase
MKNTRRSVKSTWTNHSRIEDISEELKAKPVLAKLQKYNTNAFKYIDGMQRNALQTT